MEILGDTNNQKSNSAPKLFYNENVFLYEQYNENVLLYKEQWYSIILGGAYTGSLSCSLFHSQTLAHFAYMLIHF